MFQIVLICALASPTPAQQPSPQDDPRTLLMAVRDKLLSTIDRLPKYMCTETVDRSTFDPKEEFAGHSCDDLASRRKKPGWKLFKSSSDRLRLDVAVSADSEMFSWAGENRFGDRSLADLVGGGATSTGAFASFLGAIFGSNAAEFTYNGDITVNSQALAEFGFRVPLEKSGYRIGNKRRRVIVPYDGTFLVDPKTFDLVRLVVHADQLPPSLNACESTTTLEYGIVRLNNSEFVLPKNVRLLVVNANGGEFDNRTVFSSCHEFLGESKLNFDVSETGQAATQKLNIKPLVLPEGLSFRLALAMPINTATAAAGDLVHAKLATPIKDKHTGILVPKDAAITGRIVQITRIYGAGSQALQLGIKLETIEADGALQPFDARLESVIRRRQRSFKALIDRLDLGSFDDMSDETGPDVGLLEFEDVGPGYIVNRGVEIEGMTAGPK